MFTILRNQFHTIYRKRRREVEDTAALRRTGLPSPRIKGRIWSWAICKRRFASFRLSNAKPSF